MNETLRKLLLIDFCRCSNCEGGGSFLYYRLKSTDLRLTAILQWDDLIAVLVSNLGRGAGLKIREPGKRNPTAIDVVLVDCDQQESAGVSNKNLIRVSSALTRLDIFVILSNYDGPPLRGVVVLDRIPVMLSPSTTDKWVGDLFEGCGLTPPSRDAVIEA